MNRISTRIYLIVDGDAELQTIAAATLGRMHAAMPLHVGRHADALRTLTCTEQDRGPEFLWLANALFALHSVPSQRNLLLDAMLLVRPK